MKAVNRLHSLTLLSDNSTSCRADQHSDPRRMTPFLGPELKLRFRIGDDDRVFFLRQGDDLFRQLRLDLGPLFLFGAMPLSPRR
jgi:hypothetical protein